MPIKNLGLTSLSVKQFGQFISTVLSHLTPLSADLTVKNLVAQITAYMIELEAAAGRAITCEFTKKLEEIDYLRDEIIKALDKYLDFAVAAWMIDKTRADQAKVVLEMRKRYDSNMSALPYQEETKAISFMVAGFETISGAAEESKADVLISALSSANKKFETLYSQKTKSIATDEKVRHTRAIRADITTVYTQLVGYINAVAPANQATYKTIIDSINVVISDVKATAAAEKTREETAKAKADKAVLGAAI